MEFGVVATLVVVKTAGDSDSRAIPEIGGEGAFTKALQRKLLDREIDLCVHSLKDLPTEPTLGLTLAAVPPRDSPWDVLVSNSGLSLQDLPDGSRILTGSPRRKAQVLRLRPDLRVLSVRGNVDSRLDKLRHGQGDALILAEAGLRRLGMEEAITARLPPEVMLPAPGQGALGIEIRQEDDRTRALVGCLDDATTHMAVAAERAALRRLHAGCLAPVGAWARQEADSSCALDVIVLAPDGQEALLASARSAPCGQLDERSLDHAESLGIQVAETLLLQGAAALIARVRI